MFKGLEYILNKFKKKTPQNFEESFNQNKILLSIFR